MTTQNVSRQAGAREGVILLLGSSLTIVGSVMVAPILPLMVANFAPHYPHAALWVPLAITGPALAIALFAPFAGWLADRLGRKRMLMIATFCYALLGALPAWLDGLHSIVGVRLLFGLSEAMVMTVCSTLIADYWQGEQRLKYVNRQVVTIALVGAGFFVLGGALGEHSWRWPFYLYLLPLLLLPLMARVLWEPRVSSPQSSASIQDATVDQDRRVDLMPLLAGYLLVGFGMVLSFVVPVQTPVLLVALGVTSTTLIGLATGAGLLASLVGALLWPLVRRTLGVRGCNVTLLLLIALGLVGLALAQSYTFVLVSIVVHGMGAGMLVPNAMAPVMNALPPALRGRGMGFFTAFLYLGQFISPLIVSLAASLVGGLVNGILALAIFGALYAVLWCLGVIVKRQAATSHHPSSLISQEHHHES
ncbi:MFS transporter [Terasakiispira papahanaumokuakeensis]|uniref:MFS transporter n=1 Tax=Terasakiispira papahanaumokuakeensis TaxID=197479 RepID=A0A1E2V7H2_9GAMM|nr:MFS transporter [Terasakiispira papahanaumokuakeensis]ODC02802.1 MFS transporter [Terasakiispira papahanaumokuakeensis]